MNAYLRKVLNYAKQSSLFDISVFTCYFKVIVLWMDTMQQLSLNKCMMSNFYWQVEINSLGLIALTRVTSFLIKVYRL